MSFLIGDQVRYKDKQQKVFVVNIGYHGGGQCRYLLNTGIWCSECDLQRVSSDNFDEVDKYYGFKCDV